MGFVMLGIATLTQIGINAAIFGMVAHGVITGMLFFCVGSIYDRYHTRQIAEIGGGMMRALPKLGGIFAFVAIASLGLPGLAGFWGEVMALLASFTRPRRPHVGAVPRLHGRGRHRHDPDRRLLPVDAAAGEPRRAAGAVEGAAPSATSSRSNGWRGCRCWSRIVLLGLFPRLVFGMTDDAVHGPDARWSARG